MTKAMKAIAAALARRRHDERGIALQTIIIIVVLLAIAGSVAAVLFQRASDVTSELEGVDVGFATRSIVTNQAQCVGYEIGTRVTSTKGTPTEPAGGKPNGVWSGGNTCTWTGINVNDSGANGVHGYNIGVNACNIVKGRHTTGTGTSSTCVVTIT